MAVLLYYRPQRSCDKVMFLHLSVILSTGGVSQHALGKTPPPPPADTPSLADTSPLGRHPPQTHPPLGQTPQHPADGYCSGRYASYWNAFLLTLLPPGNKVLEGNVLNPVSPSVILFTGGPHVTTTQYAIGESRITWDHHPGHVQPCPLEPDHMGYTPFRLQASVQSCLLGPQHTGRHPAPSPTGKPERPSSTLIFWEPKNWSQND